MHWLEQQPLWRLGFRPFFLAGSVFALLAILLWALWLTGAIGLAPGGGMLAWHRHEMLFGFGAAIIAGFLLTAVQNWSGLPGLKGRPLLALVLVWLAARLAWFSPLPLPALVVLQAMFLPLVALTLARPIIRRKLRNNYPIIVMVLLLAGCQWLALAGLLQADEALQRRGTLAGLWLIGALMTVLGGRVIPFFTQRGLGLATQPAARPWLERLTLVVSLGVALLTAAGFNQVPTLPMAGAFLLLSVLHGLRLRRWYAPGVRKVPLLWSLHLAYLWLLLASLGMAAWHLGLGLNQSLASHALSVGAMSAMIVAMMARVSLGHTGRPLQVPAAIVGAFVLVQLAALLRIGLVPFSSWGLGLSALCWVLAFALFVRHYAPILCAARVDGQQG
ncbi:NnrS family protein [Pseudomonas sp. GD03860]|uniref:NnrS family protein n=1 Tax=Pseudomonas TaxID=286 RepID=UPI002363CEA9|nr:MULTISPECIES: NnrS family protein [Pseudomonas]MDD2058687.1 NnrS family protein [Pseudomonas putida]MDH0636920.1 NnrS family protein [Pseudomonas sp. GD03860]